MDKVSSLEAKFEALMTKLNQSSREPTLGEIAYMQKSVSWNGKFSVQCRRGKLCEQQELHFSFEQKFSNPL